MAGQQAQAFDADGVREHLAAGRGLHDRLVNRGQQRFDVFGGEVPVDGADAAAGAPVLVLEARAHRLVERRAVHAIERTTEQPVAVVEKSECEIALLHAARIALRIHLGEQFEQLRNRRHRRAADGRERVGGLDAEPEVAVRQQLPQRLHGGRTANAQRGDRLTRAVTRFEARRFQQFQQRGNGNPLASSERQRRPLPNDRRPTAEAPEQLPVAQGIIGTRAVLVVPAAPVADQLLRCRGVEPRDDPGLFAGEEDLLQRHRAGQQVAAGAVPVPVAVMLRLRRSLVDESPVPAPREVEVPAAEFPHPGARRFRPRSRDTRHRPQDVEEIPGVSRVSFRTVGRHAHAREECRGLRIAEQVEEHRGHPALAVVVVILDPRMMVAIRDRALSGVEAQEFRAALDRQVQRRVLHTRFPRQHQRDGQGNARRVHHAVAAEPPAGDREPVPPGAHRALPVRHLQRQSPQTRHHRRIAGRHRVLRQHHRHVAVVPRLHRVRLEGRRPLRLGFQQRPVCRIAACQQGERVQRAHDRVLTMPGLRDPRRQGPAALIQNAFRFRAAEGCGGAVAAEHRKLHHDLLHRAGPPAGQLQFPAARRRLRHRDRPTEFRAGVERKRLPAHP